jgi:1,5-anhydro-D-fructose reductase (1,5-anhydro-D-mannitol-forming)
VVVTKGGERQVYVMRNPPHVHQPLIQTIVDELRGKGRCESTCASGARASWVLERCVSGYYNSRA